MRGAEDPTVCISPRPAVSEEGDELLDLLKICGSQVRTSFSGIVGFDWPAVKMVAEAEGVDTASSWWGVSSFWQVFRVVEAEWISALPKATKKEGEG